MRSPFSSKTAVPEHHISVVEPTVTEESVGQVALSPNLVHFEAPGGVEELSYPNLPEIKDMVSKMGMTRFTGVADIRAALEASPIDRGLKRRLTNHDFPDNVLHSGKVLANYLAEPGTYPKGYIPDRDAIAKVRIGAFASRLPPYLKETKVYDTIFRVAVEAEPLVRYYHEKSQRLNDRLKDQLADNPEAAYELVKSVTSHTEEEDEARQRQKWFNMLLFNPAQEPDSVQGEITRQLLTGELDSLIVADLIKGSENNHSIKAVIGLVSRTVGRDLNEEELARLLKSTELWPKEALRDLEDSRISLVQAFKAAKAESQASIQRLLGIEAFHEELEELFKKSMLRMLGSAANIKGPVVGDKAPQVLRKRISGADLHDRRSTPAPIRSQEQERQVTNTLKYVDRSGNIEDEDSPKFQEMTQEVLAKHRGEPGLTEDLSRIMEYLRKVDFQNHNVIKRAGLAKLAEGMIWVNIDGEHQQRPIYRFKPIEAAGLPVKTPIAKKHRVYLTLIDGDTIGILGIVIRDKSTQFLASIGLGSGQK